MTYKINIRNMKKIYFFIILFSIFITSFAQTPQFFNYQSLIRDINGNAISNQNVSLKINILQGSITGSIIYSEEHNVSTNQYGLVNLLIGNGNVVYGSFNAINWGSDSHYVNLQIDLEGGKNFINVGTSQLVSVPYSLFSNTSKNSESADYALYAENGYFEKSSHNNNLYYNNGGIGLGTNNPQKALHIRRSIDSYTGNVRAQAMIESSLESSAMLVLSYYPNTNYTLGQGSVWNVMTYKVNGDFAIGEETDNIPGGVGNVNRLLIQKSTGNVGIGVASPKRKLHVSDAIRLEPLSYVPYNPSKGDIYMGKDNYLHYYNGNSWVELSNGSSVFDKVSNSNDVFYTKGRIGIGTNNPQKALHIRRSIDSQTGDVKAQIMVESSLESSAMMVLSYYPNTNYTLGQGSVWNVMAYKVNGDFAIGEETDNIPGGVGNENRLLIQKSTGNVGIGVSTPKRKLHVSEAMRLEPQSVAPENPEMGDMYFGTDGKLHLYNGTGWYIVNMTAE